jgi:hypothetical protein
LAAMAVSLLLLAAVTLTQAAVSVLTEVLNGLLGRTDAEQATAIPLGAATSSCAAPCAYY